MRIPGWLIFIVAFVLFVGTTMACSFLSYVTTRDVVVDASESGVEIPEIWDLMDYVLNGAEAIDGMVLLPEDIVAQNPATATPTPVINTAVPTNTPPPGVTFTPVPPTPLPTATDPVDSIANLSPNRITILLMGIDQRSAVYDPGPFRTDTMILVQVDPIQKHVGVLSIPRDLWVNVPGYQPHRINSANYLGDGDALPGGGPQLAMDTIRANLGVKVDYYVRINFDAFFGVVDTIAPDGVEVCIRESILDEKYPDVGYGTLVVRFEPGCQLLDADRLLQYARTRATQGGDFDRNRRQQEVLQALQQEVFSLGGVTHFLSQIPSLYNQLSGGYTTNLSLEGILQLAKLVGEIPQENFTFRAINNLHVTLGSTEDGSQQILIPRQNAIRFVVQEAFNPPEDLSLAELKQRALDEDASIVILNNTDIPGLASNTREWLTSLGLINVNVGNMDAPTNATEIVIRDYTGNPWTTRYLATLFNIPVNNIQSGSDGLTAQDVVVIIGSDVQQFLSSGQ